MPGLEPLPQGLPEPPLAPPQERSGSLPRRWSGLAPQGP